MSTTTVTCAHESTYLDIDELKCRTCGQSLTFPPHDPTDAEKKDRRRDIRIVSGEHHRIYSPVEQGIEAQEDEAEQEVEVQEVVAEQEVEACPLLICHCCRAMLPPDSFYANNNPTARNRAFRAWRCRGCTSFQLRVKRQQDPEGFRERDRTRRTRYQESLTPEQKEWETQHRTGREANNAATNRYRARQDGTPVPLQRPGRLPIHVKPICRVFHTCPLRPYCTTEGKGLA